jgi:hypothetical protein
VAFTGHPGHPAERASQVVVTFAAAGQPWQVMMVAG